MYQTENILQKRLNRFRTAAALKEPDRIPFIPKVNLVYAQADGVSAYEVLADFRNMKKGVEKFLGKYECDLFWAPADYPINDRLCNPEC